MMVSTRGRYALRMLVDLAEHQGDGFVPLKDIAKRQVISKKYLEQIIPVLNTAGLLQTVRGAQGGYRLSKPADKYTVSEILKATEGNLAPVSCLEYDNNTCSRVNECETLFVWEGLKKIVNDYLGGITVQDIIDRKKAIDGDDYVI
ncbi:MAG: RrF2 family transcriptional regulator [Lachnospiraceae bacterium]|jgi:Rrf2 family protein